MKILIKQAFITNQRSPHNGTIQDILIEGGVISAIRPSISEAADILVDHPGLHISTGWMDIFSNFGDPGYEYKENLETGAAAAAAGGYTDVFVIPNTLPVVDTKSQVEYIRQKSRLLPVAIWPIGAVTKGLQGKDLAEMYDMRNSGAAAFSDGTLPVQSPGLLLKALQYIKTFEGVIIQIPDDKTVGSNGLINEGVVSTRLGLPGKPMMAEELIIARDIELVRYTGSKIHFTGVTSPKSLEYIKRAKEEGLGVSCSVTPYHLYFTDADLTGYDTNLKVYPPLRTGADVRALRNGVMDGTVDCIATHHFPHEYDSKILEFEYARYGMTGLETTYSVLRTVLPDLGSDRMAALLSENPAKIFGFERAPIAEGQPARLTLFAPAATSLLQENTTRSKSKNTPFIGKELSGRVIGIVSGDKHVLNNQPTNPL
ncbi:MAG: dihydroorotase [Puia sp.]|nr:dihydroorotase [Puia sp.]